MRHIILVFRELLKIDKFLGEDSEEDTPVPIPNTAVKLFSADDSDKRK